MAILMKNITIATTLLISLFFVNINIAVGITTTGKHCNTGPIECCKQVMDSKSPQVTDLLVKNGIGLGVLAGVKGLVGANCSPITAIGLGSGSQWYVLFSGSCLVLITFFFLSQF
jgi:hypothetical protein